MAGLRPRDVAALPRDTDRRRIVDLLTGSYDDFCTCVVAEATRWVPPELRKTLRQSRWLDDWIDALLGAEGDLQIAVFRARLEEGPHSDRTVNNGQALSAVRTRLHEARRLAKQRRTVESADPAADDPTVRRATKHLTREHPEDFARLLRQQLQAAGVDPDIAEDIPAGLIALARWAVAYQVDGVTGPSSRVRQLQGMPDDAFRQVVAADVQRDPAEPELAHPLLLERWEQALQRLAQITTELLGIPLRSHAAVADGDLSLAGLGDVDGHQRINQLRFLVHVRQRWLEQSTRARRLRRLVSLWRAERLRPAYHSVRAELRQLHSDRYQQLLAEIPAMPPTDAPGAVADITSRTSPQAMTDFGARIEQLGWTVTISQADDQARLVAVLGRTATIRLVYRRKNKGRNSGAGWIMRFLGIRINGQPGWTTLPTIADALDLAVHPASDLPRHALLYSQEPQQSQRTKQ